LSPEQTADIVAFMLSKDNYPTGAATLEGKTEPLLQIKIDAPQQ
jgi:hypothetical protein